MSLPILLSVLLTPIVAEAPPAPAQAEAFPGLEKFALQAGDPGIREIADCIPSLPWWAPEIARRPYPAPATLAFHATLDQSRAAAGLAPDLHSIWEHLQALAPAHSESAAPRLPDSVPACLRRASTSIAQHRRTEAVAVLLHAQSLKPRDLSTALKIGAVLNSAGFTEEAEEFARKLAARFPRSAAGWQFLASLLVQYGRHEEALGPLRTAAGLNPKSAAIRFAEGSAYSSLKRWEEAAIKLVLAVRLDPKNEAAWRALTHCYLASEDFLAGEAKLKQLVGEYPASAPAWYSLGCVQVPSGLRQIGLKSWRKAVELRPRYADAWNQIGVFQLVEADRKGAMESFERALKADRAHAEAANNRGWLLFTDDKLDRAIADFQTALKRDPTYTRAMVNLIRAFAKMGDRARANEVCDRLAALDAPAGASLRTEIAD